jgi:GNAT superfamily N-acetyltransferase
MTDITIRKGVESDIPDVLILIKELAEYEQSSDSVEVTEDQLLADGFGISPAFEFLVAIHKNKAVGLSLFYYRYSTWKGKGLYLEDLVVTKSSRGWGIGSKLLLETAKFAKKQHCTGLYWQVLDWNTPAIEFYKGLGTKFDSEWVNCKLDQKSLERIK